MSKTKVIFAVDDDLVGDARVNKMALTLTNSNYEVLVIGRILPNSLKMDKTPYKIRRVYLLFKKGPFFYAEMNIRLFFILLFSSYDIATANDLDTLPAVYFASRLRKKKIVYDSHEYFTEVPELITRPNVRKIWLKIEQYIFPKLKNCIAVSSSIANIYEQKYKVPVLVVRNVPMMINFQSQKSDLSLPSNNVILYQGALNVGRGLEMLIDSMEYISECCLLIIGEGTISEELRLRVVRLKLEQKVFFAGKIEYSKLQLYTNMATIGVSLEENLGDSYKYSLPNKIFDYIKCGKPVLVSDLPEMAKIIKEYNCGEILEYRNPKFLSDKLQSMLGNASMLESYRDNCKKAATELCWENEQQRVLDLYNGIRC